MSGNQFNSLWQPQNIAKRKEYDYVQSKKDEKIFVPTAPNYFDVHQPPNLRKQLTDDDIPDIDLVDSKADSDFLVKQLFQNSQCKISSYLEKKDIQKPKEPQTLFQDNRDRFKLRNETPKNWTIGDRIYTSLENPSNDSNFKRPIGPVQTIHIPNPQNQKQSNLHNFFPKATESSKQSFLYTNVDGTIKYAQKNFQKLQPSILISQPKQNQTLQLVQVVQTQMAAVPQIDEKKRVDKINLNDLPEEERRKVFKELSKVEKEKKCPQYIAEKEKERKKLEALDDQRLKEKGQKQAEELLKEGNSNLFSSIKIEKKKPSESKRLTTFKMMLESTNGEYSQVGKPIFEFNRLLKYLFLKNYFAPDIQDQECKVIPNKFESSEEYCKIFEYLFLNESSAQLKQELQEFLKKMNNTTKYRKIQIKIDETEYDKDGTIFLMRGPQQQEQNLVNNTVENEKEEENNDNRKIIGYEKLKDGICDLTQLKNYIVLISSKFSIKLSKLNQVKEEDRAFLGMLIEPQKQQFLHQIKIQTFVERSKFNIQQWYNVILFPLQKITTFIREYQMITQLGYRTSLSSLIYNPTHQQHLIGSDIGGVWTAQFENIIPNKQVMGQFFDLIKDRYNHSQAKSIEEIILKDKGICLLQGPPGTGKTHTLIGVLSGVYQYMSEMNKFPRKKILICAPSNAAIDEIIVRVISKGGLFDSEGNSRQVKLIRLGLIDEESDKCELIKKVSLEDLAQHKLFQTEKYNAAQDQKTTADLRIEICQIQNQIKKLEKRTKVPGLPSEERKTIKEQLDQFIDLRKTKSQYLDKIRQNKKLYKETYTMQCEKLLNDAEIICSTLSSSGSDKLTRFIDQIELLIVDEAAQCTEPSNIIPLRLGIKKMILIGDPRQLPATTFSMVSNQTLYNRSLFERILDNNFQPYFLDIQYRMHSEIRIFPSLYFYQGKLKDHESTNNRTIPKDFFNKRVLFLDVIAGQEKRDGTSYTNEQEAAIIIDLIKNILQNFLTQNIGVICSYKSQVKYIKQQIKQQIPLESSSIHTLISVNTVDSFQGQEKDIILFSCVRSSESGGIGFLNDGRRMNVALTRAKNALLIIGNAITLSKSELWRQLLLNIKGRHLYRSINNQSEFKFDRLINDEWPDANTQMSNKLIQVLSQTNQGNQSRVSYNISDFAIDGTQAYTDVDNHIRRVNTHNNHHKHRQIEKNKKTEIVIEK